MTCQFVFPARLQPMATALLQSLAQDELSPPMPGFTVNVSGETLSAPSRTFHTAAHLRSIAARTEDDMRVLASCFGSTNWDGHVREESVRLLLSRTDRPWVVPFIVRLVGEYVVEIIEAIHTALPCVDAARFGEFARENPAFMATTRRRATSYWNCYFRHRFPHRSAYPGLLVLDAIDGFAGTACMSG
jgi:hypothetical protein